MTHPGVPTTGAPARWSRSMTEIPSDSDDDDCMSSSRAQKKLVRERDGPQLLTDEHEHVFVMEEPVYGSRAP